MTNTTASADFFDLARRLDRLERRHSEITARLDALTGTAERTDATVTQVAWTVDRFMDLLGLNDERN